MENWKIFALTGDNKNKTEKKSRIDSDHTAQPHANPLHQMIDIPHILIP